ncbi:MAG: hypothetical protein H6807_11105 [Planctomycetes bacterium]|nr:hypothetical protein [Planctomycetota bacterium]
MHRHIAPVILLLLLVVSAFQVEAVAQQKNEKETPLVERDPDLAAWIDTLVLNLQKDHKAIRNSSAQALIAIGEEAVPALQRLREVGDREARNLATRILERMAKESGRNLFKDDLGGVKAETLADICARALNLSDPQKESLGRTIASAQEEEKKIRGDQKQKKANAEEVARRRRNLQTSVKAELQGYLDARGVDFVLIKLGWGGGKTVDEEGNIVDPRERRDISPEDRRKMDQDR